MRKVRHEPGRAPVHGVVVGRVQEANPLPEQRLDVEVEAARGDDQADLSAAGSGEERIGAITQLGKAQGCVAQVRERAAHQAPHAALRLGQGQLAGDEAAIEVEPRGLAGLGKELAQPIAHVDVRQRPVEVGHDRRLGMCEGRVRARGHDARSSSARRGGGQRRLGCRLSPMHRTGWLGRLFFGASLAVLLLACSEGGAPSARKLIRQEHAPRVASFVEEELARHQKGLRYAADRIAAGFVRVEGAEQEKDMRQVLKLLRSPKRGVQELVISPMSFLAVVGKDGICIARDGEPDRMRGMDLGKSFESVGSALAGHQAMEIGEFANTEPGGKPSVTILMAAPAHYEGEVVGALVLGIPLWRLQQQLSRQLQMELAGKDGVVIWVYVYKGDELYHHGTPPDLDQLVPDAATRSAGLAKSPGGFTGDVQQYAFWYGYGVRPLRVLGPDVGVVVFRMEPPR